MRTKNFTCFMLVIFVGSISYLMITTFLLPYGILRPFNYEPLMTGTVEERPRSTYLIKPKKLMEKLCENSACLKNKRVNWKMVIFVKSKADYFQRRNYIRNTWGSFSFVQGARFEVIFVIGTTSDRHHLALLKDEAANYGDILQFNGPDDYDNMPYKVLAGMEWASNNLDEDTLYASADDDFLVDMQALVQHITNLTSQIKQRDMNNSILKTNPARSLPIMCIFKKGTDERPVRQRGCKWYVSYYEYWHTFFPPYCHGGIYAMPLLTATKLANGSRIAPMLRLDDVWITGILRQRINISDDLIVQIENVTKHFGAVNEAVVQNMNKQWKSMSRFFNDNTTCRCIL